VKKIPFTNRIAHTGKEKRKEKGKPLKKLI
jgi:hypothetical protein